MMHAARSKHPRRGAALLLCMLFIVLTLSLASTLGMRTMAALHHGDIATAHSKVFAGAEAALAHAHAAILRGESGTIGWDASAAVQDDGSTPDFSTPGINPQSLRGDDTLKWFTFARPEVIAGVHLIIIYACATDGRLTSRIEACYRRTETAGGGDTAAALQLLSWRQLPPHAH